MSTTEQAQIIRIERELARRRALKTDTEFQIEAARARSGRPIEPDYEDDRSKWSATEWQAFHARGYVPVKGQRDQDDD